MGTKMEQGRIALTVPTFSESCYSNSAIAPKGPLLGTAPNFLPYKSSASLFMLKRHDLRRNEKTTISLVFSATVVFL